MSFFHLFPELPPPPEKLKSQKKKAFRFFPPPLRIPGHAPATSLGMENNKNFRKTVSLIFSPLSPFQCSQIFLYGEACKPKPMLIASQKEKKEALNMEKDAPIKTSHIKFPGIVYTLTQQGHSPPPLLETSTGALKYAVCMFFFICVCVGGGRVIQSRVYHITSQRMNLCIIYSGVSRNS